MDSSFISNLILATVRMAVPLIFIATAELYSERAGMVNIGLEGLAANLWGRKEYICPMMDARRKQVYTGIYRFGREGLQVVEDQMACPVEKILEICRQLREEIVFLGDGVPVYLDIIESTRKNLKEQPDWTYAPAHLNRQRAGALGRLALDYLRQGRQEKAADHAPIYLRKSQAERELNARGRSLDV